MSWDRVAGMFFSFFSSFFLFWRWLFVTSIVWLDVRFFFSIPNGDNVTGPKEKSWRLAYHVRPAMLCVSFFPCWNSFSLCCVCVCVDRCCVQGPPTDDDGHHSSSYYYCHSDVQVYYYSFFILFFFLFLFKNEEINKSEIKSCWFLLFSPAAPERNRRITITISCLFFLFFIFSFRNNVPYFFWKIIEGWRRMSGNQVSMTQTDLM